MLLLENLTLNYLLSVLLKSMGVPLDIMQFFTQQTLRWSAKQEVELEAWALEGFDVGHIWREMIAYKSDHIAILEWANYFDCFLDSHFNINHSLWNGQLQKFKCQ